jgi:hypothetical protein
MSVEKHLAATLSGMIGLLKNLIDLNAMVCLTNLLVVCIILYLI